MMFRTGQWQRVEELFGTAAELHGEAREQYLRSLTGQDVTLLPALRELLALTGAQEQIAGVIESAAQSVIPEANWVGRRVGPYRVVREIGRGGMGIVFEARRDDDEFQQRVALKIGAQALGSTDLRSRFLQERQILATLEHPNIARMLDGGTHEGLAYFAMEFVDGIPLTSYAQEGRLSVRQRVELFLQVAKAVEYAHSRLVVHRDLKPGNILVTGDGTPKLLDFGIAKLLDKSVTGEFTSAMMWTPDYASPEQVRGLAVTTRSDVYALGLVLYELLTGRKAQEADTSSPLALDRSICEVEAPLASARGEMPELRGDIDTILATALRKEEGRRYESVTALAMDLQRFLNGEPIQARPGTAWYRAEKFLRRNRWGVAAAVLVVGSLVAGASVAVMQARRAERRFTQVRKMANSFLFDVHDQIQNLPGATAARAFVLTNGVTYLDSLAAEAGGDLTLLAELAQSYFRVAQVQGDQGTSNLGQTRAALDSYGKAIATCQRILRAEPANREGLRLMARSYARRGELELLVLGRQEGGVDSLRLGLEAAAQLAAGKMDAKDMEVVVAVKRAYADRNLDKDPKTALQLYGEVGKLATALWKETGAIQHVGMALNVQMQASRAYRAMADPERAYGILQDAVGTADEALRRDPDNARLQDDVSGLYIDLGTILGSPDIVNLGRAAESLVYLERAAPMVEKLLGDGKDARSRQTMAILQSRLAQVKGALGRGDALSHAQRCVSLLEPMLKLEPGSFRLTLIMNTCYRTLADVELALGRAQDSLRTCGQLLRLAETIAGVAPQELGAIEVQISARATTAAALIRLKRWEEAEKLLQEAATRLEAIRKERPEDLFFLRDWLQVRELQGDLEAGRGANDHAEKHYRAALEGWGRLKGLAVESPFTRNGEKQLERKLAALKGAGR